MHKNIKNLGCFSGAVNITSEEFQYVRGWFVRVDKELGCAIGFH